MASTNERIAVFGNILSVTAKIATVLILPVMSYCGMTLIRLNEDVAVLKTKIAAIEVNTQRTEDVKLMTQRMQAITDTMNEHIKHASEIFGKYSAEMGEIHRRIDSIERRTSNYE
mgnify:CR=1 FL=1